MRHCQPRNGSAVTDSWESSAPMLIMTMHLGIYVSCITYDNVYQRPLRKRLAMWVKILYPWLKVWFYIFVSQGIMRSSHFYRFQWVTIKEPKIMSGQLDIILDILHILLYYFLYLEVVVCNLTEIHLPFKKFFPFSGFPIYFLPHTEHFFR